MSADPHRRKCGVRGLTNRPDTHDAQPAARKDRHSGDTAPLQAAGRADPDQMTEQHAEVEACDVNQEALQDIPMPAEMRAPQAAGLVGVRKRSLDQFAPAAQQALATVPPNTPAIRIDRRLGLLLRPRVFLDT